LWCRAGSKKDSRGSEQLVLDAVRSGMQFQKFVADAALKVWQAVSVCLSVNFNTFLILLGFSDEEISDILS